MHGVRAAAAGTPSRLRMRSLSRCTTCRIHSAQHSQASYTFTAADQSALADGVGTLAASGWATSTQYVFRNAEAIATSPSNNAALVSAAGYSPGRLLFLGSASYFTACTGSTGICRLLANAAQWAAAGKTSGIRLAAVGAGGGTWTTTGAIASLVAQVGVVRWSGGEQPAALDEVQQRV